MATATATATSKKAIGFMSKITTLHMHHANLVPRLASRFVCKFLCRLCKTTTWNDQISSLLENGDGMAKNSTISVWTRAQSPLFSCNINSLLSSNWATWDNREIDWKDAKSIFNDVSMEVAVWCRIVRSLISIGDVSLSHIAIGGTLFLCGPK